MKPKIKEMFDELRVRIDKKERELIGQIDISLEESLKELESYQRILNQKMDGLTSNVQFLKSNISDSAANALAFYAENNRLLAQLAEQDSKDSALGDNAMKSSLNAENENLKKLKVDLGALGEAVGSLRSGSSSGKRMKDVSGYLDRSGMAQGKTISGGLGQDE